MSYFFNNRGSLNFSKSYIAPSAQSFSSATQSKTTADAIRPQSLYVESQSHVTNGHLVQWTGTAAMFNTLGNNVTSFSAQNGHEFALSQVEPCDTIHSKSVAGIIIDHAAGPGDSSFKHKGDHSVYNCNDNAHIHRLATSGSVVLAWVCVDEHENALDGVYTRYLNGVEDGLYIVRELGDEYFSLERVGSNSSIDELATSVDLLTDRFDALTQ